MLYAITFGSGVGGNNSMVENINKNVHRTHVTCWKSASQQRGITLKANKSKVISLSKPMPIIERNACVQYERPMVNGSEIRGKKVQVNRGE